MFDKEKCIPKIAEKYQQIMVKDKLKKNNSARNSIEIWRYDT